MSCCGFEVPSDAWFKSAERDVKMRKRTDIRN